jgi:hypothetical protein
MGHWSDAARLYREIAPHAPRAEDMPGHLARVTAWMLTLAGLADAMAGDRRSLFSTTDGLTRTNLLMARSLLALGRAAEAIAILRPALRGGVDGSNTDVTHTELREELAHAFELAGQPDSARVHYQAVERAWRRANPQFRERYQRAKAKIAVR